MAEDGMMTEDGIGQHRERNAASIGTQAKMPFAGLREKGQQLLPGIPNDITLDHIAPELPWSAFHNLSFVSSCWRQAIGRHEVYNARIRSQAAETVVVLSHTHPEQVIDETFGEVVHGIAVYSIRDKSCYSLPGIPGLQRGIPKHCQCIVLDSRIYVMGGLSELREHGNAFSAEVYVLDLAGQRKWKRCADMQEGRVHFGCGVMDGKIYVFGGMFHTRREHGCVDGSEVYDPEANAWSSISPMITRRYDHEVSAIGEELYAYQGHCCEKKTNYLQVGWKLEVYHPGRNEWREVEPYPFDLSVEGSSFSGSSFSVGGKLHRMMHSGIDVLDTDNNSATWRDLHSFEDVGRTLIGSTVSHEWAEPPRVVKAVNGELWALVGDYRCTKFQFGILQSRGFGSEKRELVWEKVNLPLAFENLETSFICLAQL